MAEEKKPAAKPAAKKPAAKPAAAKAPAKEASCWHCKSSCNKGACCQDCCQSTRGESTGCEEASRC